MLTHNLVFMISQLVNPPKYFAPLNLNVSVLEDLLDLSTSVFYIWFQNWIYKSSVILAILIGKCG